MGTDNFLTIEDLTAASEFDVLLPSSGKTLRCRKLGRRERLTLLAPLPPESDSWPAVEGEGEAREASRKARLEALAAWQRTLSPEQQIARQQSDLDAEFRLIALASVSPRLTAAQARLLGDDYELVVAEIMRRSGPLEPPRNGASAPGPEAP